MVTIELRGHITKAGELEVELPDDLPEGEVKVTIEVPTDKTANSEPLVSLYGILAHLRPSSEKDFEPDAKSNWSQYDTNDAAQVLLEALEEDKYRKTN